MPGADEAWERLLEERRPFFEEAYRADTRNAARQPFADYWRWVRTFFVSGGAGHPGWFAQAGAVLRPVRAGREHDELRARLYDLGARIAAEWAKERRRVYSIPFQGTPNLQQWGRRLERAAASDTGDGAAIAAVLSDIEQELSRALERA